MKYHRIYTVTAVLFLVVFTGFLFKVCFWPHPQGAKAAQIESSVPQNDVAKQTLNDENCFSSVNYTEKVDVLEVPCPEDYESQSLLETLVIESLSINSGKSYDFTSAADSSTLFPQSLIQPDSAASSSTAASSDTGSSASSDGSNGGSTPAADSGQSTPHPPATGGGGAPTLSDPKLFMFVGLRTQACFRVLEYPKLRPLFAPDFVWHVTGFQNEAEWARMMQLVRQYNKHIIIGYYHSACTTIPSAKDFDQPTKMPNEQVPYNWILRYTDGTPFTWPDTTDRFFLDLRKQDVRQSMIALAVARAKHYGYDALSFDNCYWGMGIPFSTGQIVSAKEWTEAFMKFYEEAGKAAQENGLKCIVNVAMRANELPMGFEAISPYVDGIMTEMPFHESVSKPSQIEKELAAYEKVLKEGKMVFLLQTIKGRGMETLSLARPLVDKYDKIYICIDEFWFDYFRHGLNDWDMSKAPPISTWYRNP